MNYLWRLIMVLNAIGLFIFVSTQVWWVGTGYCIGSFVECNL